ncbi:MAG: hypothetical protein F4Y01_16075 [Gammaproteobacteria bacterium]|nr:hypothetical protein [Gammaproteobacteria bacterium]
MRSRTTRAFRDRLRSLPEPVRRAARIAYGRFQHDPSHPGLRFKRIHALRAIDSVRVARGYRAIGKRDDGGMLWFWIGSHSDYDQVLKQL